MIRPGMRWLALASRYGMVPVLALLCLAFSILTLREQERRGVAAADALVDELSLEYSSGTSVVIAAGNHEDDRAFVARLEEKLLARGCRIEASAVGDAQHAIATLKNVTRDIEVLALSDTAASWLVWADRKTRYPVLASAELVTPPRYLWPDFLKRDNLFNIASQIAVIAIVAIGATLVIIAGGIDLSVGSLIGLAAVLSARLIEDWAGARSATGWGMAACCAVGILACGLVGAISGLIVTLADVKPFVVTLGMLMATNGLALKLSGGESIHYLPSQFTEFAMGYWFGLPNAVVLMLVLYVAAHVLMSRTTLGRYLYAVGGNLEAARLAGVPIHRVRLLAYVASGLLAGLGGVIMASQFKSGVASYGQEHLLFVIAAVVVGGTSLSGGEGQMFGTLIGAFIIAVIQNGMNLLRIDPFTQKIVLGLVLVAAVIFDRYKQRLWQEQ